MRPIPASVFKRHLSEYLARVAYRRERFIISRRGKPIAQLAPPDDASAPLGRSGGWLEDSDEFFSIIGSIVADREAHTPRAWKARKK